MVEQTMDDVFIACEYRLAVETQSALLTVEATKDDVYKSLNDDIIGATGGDP